MKKYYLSWLLPVIILGACATGTPIREPAIKAERFVPPAAASAMEQLRWKIKQNTGDLEKSFSLDDDGQIIVSAEFKDDLDEYGVVYDLENAQALDNGSYAVNFTINDKIYGAHTEDSLVWKPGPGSEGVLFSLDDYFMETWEKYFDLFDKYDCKITFFIQSAWDPDLLQSFCTEALKRGHDIGFHSINHPDLRKVSREVFMEETVEPAKLYREAGVPLSAFAFPFGFYETWMYDLLWPSFDILRGYGTTYRLYSGSDVRAGFLISKAIDNTVIKGDQNFENTIRLMLMTVKFLGDGRILPVTTHDISDDAAWGITPERLEFFIKTVKDLNLKFYRYADFDKVY
ncbi:MAG: polysaccharide deacetylase family protein [Treponema sp.]|nr:polysaccharide deacetylase family protein [Treponema sp.]